MKKTLINAENPEGIIIDYTPEEIALAEETKADLDAKLLAEQNAKIEKENLKASAKQKLMNGEALTEDEANVMVGL